MPRLQSTARILAFSFLFLSLSVAWVDAPSRGDETNELTEKQQVEFFADQVRPILQANCVKCHGGEAKIRGGLRLTNRELALKGGDTGPAVVPGKPDESLLVEAINYASYEMPPTGKLTQAKIDVLTQWVKMGAPWTPGDEIAPAVADSHGPPQVNEKTKSFWSFQTVARPDVPAVADRDWIRNPIDAFVLAKLEAAKLSPAPSADKVALLRRATYDLTGLPPTPDEVAAFLADTSDDAFEKVVDRLLDSPHYGEKWGRHWLDLVRYAESNSYERDDAKPFVWRYRDYVIRSLNEDKPYDQFVVEQLAGDELPGATPDAITATGFYRLGIWQDEPVDAEKALYDDLDDIVTTTGQAFLGLTVNCARCHDHKLDPFPQQDYYRLLAFFRNVRRYGVRGHDTVVAASVRKIGAEEQIRAHEQKLLAVQAKLAELERLVRDDFTGIENDEFQTEAARIEIVQRRVPRLLGQDQFDRYVALTRRRDELRKSRPDGMIEVLCVKENGPQSPPTHVLVRGNHTVKGPQVEPAFPSVLSPPAPEIETRPEANSSGRRLTLARWIASPENPLAARVMVNRLWQHHFGRGIVRSANNFGLQGDPPTHPKLLDWLASEFVARGWRMKSMHKLIMMSNTYQMSSRADQQSLDADPENNLFSRFDMRRLTAEEIRDSILAVNGSLNRDKMYGPSIYTIVPAEVLAGQSRPGAGWGQSSPEDRARRSIYIHAKRSLVTPMMAAFDVADMDFTCPVRFVTTQPTQALGLLNGQFINEQAAVFADFLRHRAPNDVAQQVRIALLRVLQRQPSQQEINRGVGLIESLQEDHGASADDALKYYCLVALNLNEFMYLD